MVDQNEERTSWTPLACSAPPVVWRRDRVLSAAARGKPNGMATAPTASEHCGCATSAPFAVVGRPQTARRSPRAVYRPGMWQGVGLVVAMGILALIASGVFDGLRGRIEPALASGRSAGEQQRVASADLSGRAHVIDGDTIEVAGERVRLIALMRPKALRRAPPPADEPTAAAPMPRRRSSQ